jgi:asparagine synthase (glutamine-hydrolysing)
MCGIYITNIPYEKEDVINKLNKIKYRGPDNTGYLKKGHISLGHLRLSILDIDERSNQPFVFDNYIITFNGEIYNYNEIKQDLIILGHQFCTESDTEVLIQGYKRWGKEILKKVNGMFAFSIYDINRNIIFSARDRLGVKPFFYYWKAGVFEVCSQLGPLINDNSSINSDAIPAYLDCGYVPSPMSIVENVYKLEPGKSLTIDLSSRELIIEKYWDLQEVEIKNISFDKAKKELHTLLIDAVKIRMQSDVPLGTFLSGGVDSALVTSIASKISEKPINTFTIGFKDPKFDESKVAEEFSRILKTNHKVLICEASDVRALIPTLLEVYDEPFADSSALPSLLLNKETKKHVTVALSGDGGDESFLGYNHFDLMTKFLKISKFPFLLRKFLAVLPGHLFLALRKETWSSILQSKTSDDFSTEMFLGFSSLQKKVNRKWFKGYSNFKKTAKSPYQRMADLNIKLWLENDSNVKVDRASMANSVEVRSPFLDYRVIEFARSLPVKYRYDNGIKKKILKDILEEYIPKEVFNLPKKGFSIPLGDWIKNDLRQEFEKTLTIEKLSSIPNLNIKLFMRYFKEHMKQDAKRDFSSSIWKVYLFLKWKEKHNL